MRERSSVADNSCSGRRSLSSAARRSIRLVRVLTPQRVSAGKARKRLSVCLLEVRDGASSRAHK